MKQVLGSRITQLYGHPSPYVLQLVALNEEPLIKLNWSIRGSLMEERKGSKNRSKTSLQVTSSEGYSWASVPLRTKSKRHSLQCIYKNKPLLHISTACSSPQVYSSVHFKPAVLSCRGIRGSALSCVNKACDWEVISHVAMLFYPLEW